MEKAVPDWFQRTSEVGGLLSVANATTLLRPVCPSLLASLVATSIVKFTILRHLKCFALKSENKHEHMGFDNTCSYNVC